ncbi:MAG: endonuclease III [Oscillospiraceae bacterium]|nr:endonuclease III [Oscillospiraceae bacterium]
MRKKERALSAVERLKKRYPEAVCSLEYQKPYELLIATRLSAQCTDARVNIVTKELFQRFTSLQAFAEADLTEIEEIVKPCGLYKTKAKSIKEMCIQLIEEFDSELPDTIEELTSLSGIGRKTANLILGDVFHKPAVVVDTHCIRITNRLGLADTDDPHKAELQLKEVLPPTESSDFCHRLVHFGREICKARKPLCAECELQDICKEFQKNSKKK